MICITMPTEIAPVTTEKTEHCWSRRKIHTPTSLKSELNGSGKVKTPNLDLNENGVIPEERKRTATLKRRKTFHGQIPIESRYAATPASRFRRPRRSISDDSTISSTSSLVGPFEDKSQYQEALDKVAHDDRWKKEMALGTRVGFYRLYRDVGKGNFSKVKMGVHYLTKEKVAVKIIEKIRLQTKNTQMLSKEISAMESIQHPYIIRLYEVIDTPSKMFLVMEYAEGGELFHKVANGGRIPEPEAKLIFAQLTSAVAHMKNPGKFPNFPQGMEHMVPQTPLLAPVDKWQGLRKQWKIGGKGKIVRSNFTTIEHKLNIIHRDLKAENVFITSKSTIKVGDFGFSTRIQNPKEVLLTFCGSPPYVAPEIFQNENYVGPSVDFWSMGVLLFFIVTASLPFKGETVSVVKRKILNGQFNVPKYLSKECINLICGLLKLEASKRLSTNQIRNCAWLKDIKFPNATCGKNNGEKDAKAALEKMGITEKMLKEHSEKGAKSCIMGTYRILMHKNEVKSCSEDKEKSSKNIIITCPTFKSKTCTIL